MRFETEIYFANAQVPSGRAIPCHEVSPRMVAYWQEQEVSLSAHFRTIKLRRLTAAHVSDYQRARLAAGKAAKTINGAVSVLRQVLKHARLWYRFAEDYKPVRNNKRSIGRTLSFEEQKKLFDVFRHNVNNPDGIWLQLTLLIRALGVTKHKDHA